MDFETVRGNLLSALERLLNTRVVICSPREKIADLPAAFVLAALLLAFPACVVMFVLGLVFRYDIRLEKNQ